MESNCDLVYKLMFNLWAFPLCIIMYSTCACASTTTAPYLPCINCELIFFLGLIVIEHLSLVCLLLIQLNTFKRKRALWLISCRSIGSTVNVCVVWGGGSGYKCFYILWTSCVDTLSMCFSDHSISNLCVCVRISKKHHNFREDRV